VKAFKYFIGFFLIAVLSAASVSADNFSFPEHSAIDSIKPNARAQFAPRHRLFNFIDTEVETIISISQPDVLPLSFEDITTKTYGLRQRSYDLSNVQDCKFIIYNCECFNQFSVKEIIFPFHSFW
jgi:hypothetical protein